VQIREGHDASGFRKQLRQQAQHEKKSSPNKRISWVTTYDEVSKAGDLQCSLRTIKIYDKWNYSS